MPGNNGEEHRDNTGNLRAAWKPGESGNPAGRPRGSGLTDKLRRLLDEPDQDDPTRTVADRLIEAVVHEARRGNVRLIELIFDRMDGPIPRQAIAASCIATEPRHYIVSPPRVIGEN